MGCKTILNFKNTCVLGMEINFFSSFCVCVHTHTHKYIDTYLYIVRHIHIQNSSHLYLILVVHKTIMGHQCFHFSLDIRCSIQIPSPTLKKLIYTGNTLVLNLQNTTQSRSQTTLIVMQQSFSLPSSSLVCAPLFLRKKHNTAKIVRKLTTAPTINPTIRPVLFFFLVGRLLLTVGLKSVKKGQYFIRWN